MDPDPRPTDDRRRDRFPALVALPPRAPRLRPQVLGLRRRAARRCRRRSKEFWRRLGFLVIQGYGLTETAPIVTLNHPLRTSSGSVGTPIEGVEVRIAEDGEILVRGENVTSGYYDRPITRGGGRATRTGWFHTGDIGERDAEGRLFIKGARRR
jgi:long-subunit acyl-CoA synthetase (AMP-forming)